MSDRFIFPDHDFRLSAGGYWSALEMGLDHSPAPKVYIDLRLHEDVPASVILQRMRLANGSGERDPRLRCLCEQEAAHAAAGGLGALHPVVIQLREGQAGMEEKIYFRPERQTELDMRALSLRLAALCPVPEKRGAIRREILRRTALAPLFYIALAWRPDLEIETYVDTDGAGPWDVEQAAGLVAQLTGDPTTAGRTRGLLDHARTHGLQCSHISCDLEPATGTVSVFLDAEGEDRLSRLQACADALCPGGMAHLRPPRDLTAFMIGVKIGRGSTRFVMEYADPRIVDTI